MSSRAARVVFVCLFASAPLTVAGCLMDLGSPTAHEALDPASPALVLHAECGQTICQARSADCRRRRDECFDRCENALYDAGYSCVAECSDLTCSTCTSDGCAEPRYEFQVTGAADEAILESCSRSMRALEACGYEVDADLCAHYARLERPEVTSSYDCMAASACGTDLVVCDPAPTRWGLDLCLELNARCDAFGMGCTYEQADAIDAQAAWLRDDVRDAALQCLEEPDCLAVYGCLNAWFEVIAP